MSLNETLKRTGPKRLLAIEGGGIRGVLELEVLKKIETQLGAGDPGFRLSDYFDYMAGTSTGAIIATGLSLGMSVDELLDFYVNEGESMFDKASLFRRFRYKFEDEKLAGMLQSVFGADTTLGTDRLNTLLLIVMSNATTDSPWPITNNPYARYNDRQRTNCNLELPLWELVRASTAAPTFFPPERVQVGSEEFLFIDGGITPYNNPAFLLYLHATNRVYWPLLDHAQAPEVSWPAATGQEQLFLLSLGSGYAANANRDLMPGDMNLLYNAATIPSALMFSAETQQDLLCRVFGDCQYGHRLDRELGDLMGPESAGSVPHKLFRYVRYTPDLSRAGLDRLGLTAVQPEEVQKMDAVSGIAAMRSVGQALADSVVKAEHFPAG